MTLFCILEAKMLFLKKFLKNESGATAIEYGLIAALVSVVAITALTNLGENITDKFQLIAEEIQTANPQN